MHKTASIERKKQRVREVLHNLNWLLESHNSFAELVKIDDENVVIRTTGACAECDTGCVETAFRERMPDINLIHD
jgi:Fe-S cluster biogenesis protein NfuA